MAHSHFVAVCSVCLKADVKFDVWQRRLIDAFRRMVYRNPLVLIVLVVDCFVDLIWVGGWVGRERDNSNLNSKNLFYKDCSLGSFKNVSNN